ncbi:MAG TPA: hypothetical protein DCL48_01170 [Alphaproteobacteria bacterium]|nr:hypothetical protein [Alphaproteobacteria bacterium]
MTERIQIAARLRTPDAGGGAVLSWTVIATVWAQIEVLSSGESSGDEGRQHIARYRLTVRRRSDIAAGQSAVWRGRRLYLRGLEDAGPQQPFVVITADDGDPL